MKDPTIQELMEFVDGTLDSSRYREVEQSVVRSKNLQREVMILKQMRNAVFNQRVTPSKKFTAEIMNKIMPEREESFWFRIIKNSSNVFAMAVVLLMIGMVLFSTSSSTLPSSHQLSNTVNSFSNAYNSALTQASSFVQEYTSPVSSATKSSSGKMLLIGIFIFSLYIVFDEVIGKRMLIRK